ncbi:MAG: Xaa-Pro peptidase family protein [Alphaproteobacteria bacterium]
MAIHFSVSELADRRARACTAMGERGLDGLLIFRQESMFYLTGYDTFGYVYFQCLYLGADGTLTLLTRVPDLRQAQHTSIIEDIRIWVDAEGASPADALRDVLESHGARGKKLGVEWEAYGLTARSGQMLTAALDGFATLEDASDLVSRLRVVKSEAELRYVQRLAGPGAFEGDILAAMQGAVFRGGGDDPANETIIGSGRDALLCRYFTGRRHLDPQDQLTLEFAGVYRHYHACLMRTILVGAAAPEHRAMHEAAVASLEAATAALQPGKPIGGVFDAHAAVLDAAGYETHRLNACGYSLGTTFAPNWMDWPMFYTGNPFEAGPGMVFFIHICIFDSDSGRAMTTGRTVEVTQTGAVPLSTAALDLVVK